MATAATTWLFSEVVVASSILAPHKSAHAKSIRSRIRAADANVSADRCLLSSKATRAVGKRLRHYFHPIPSCMTRAAGSHLRAGCFPLPRHLLASAHPLPSCICHKSSHLHFVPSATLTSLPHSDGRGKWLIGASFHSLSGGTRLSRLSHLARVQMTSENLYRTFHRFRAV